MRKLTYRLRGCPSHLDKEGVSQLLSRALGNIVASDVNIYSLATTLNPFERPPTKVATLMFKTVPDLINTQERQNEWTFSIDGVKDPLILDTHFLGWTPFNDPEDEQHEFDLIAISGLASHPFGSWQPKGNDKDYMWIRDCLPDTFPGIRAIIYGYDTTLHNSNSFKSIKDIALTFAESLESCSWHLPSGKPLVFVAHSLGGIISKEAFTLLARREDTGKVILDRIKGGIFFGVPSSGMVTSHLHAMVKGQPNIGILEELSTQKADYLQRLDDQFSGLISTRNMQMCWAYETKTSPTVKQLENGTFSRSGPQEILVSKDSATRNLYKLYSSSTFPIDESHSDMVKFRRGDSNLNIVLTKLQAVCGRREHQLHNGLLSTHEPSTYPDPTPRTMMGVDQGVRYDIPGRSLKDIRHWGYEDLIRSLEVPGLDGRIKLVEERFGHSFDWIFDEGVYLTRWLEKKGTDMFWIHGKPGSGKSTLMKFIFQSKNVQEVLHKLASESLRVSAGFFFHDRGTALQKSLEGLLRSVLLQILERSGDLATLVIDDFRKRYQLSGSGKYLWTISELERYIRLILQQDQIKLELYLFFDALDEFDGTPQFISGFLKDMVEIAKKSSNVLKILFSSRPWEAFRNQFHAIQSLQLQDYTKDDIQQFCIGHISSNDVEVAVKLRPLIPTITGNAEGVFLWVKLVVNELISEARTGTGSEELANILDSIPRDLQTYYSRTIQRIPINSRFEGFVAFSTTYYANGYLNNLQLLGAISCSCAQTFQEAMHNLKELYGVELSFPRKMWTKALFVMFKYGPHRLRSQKLQKILTRKKAETELQISSQFRGNYKALRERQNKVMTSTGNLLEFLPATEDGDVIFVSRPTLAHQTVREFIRNHDFERSILGHDLTRAQENGHTFLAKRHLAVGNLLSAQKYLLLHETTTGTSMIDFIDSVPEDIFLQEYDGPLQFAMGGSLRLYIAEKLRRSPNTLRATEERLLSHIPQIYDRFEGHLNLSKFILDNGYKIEKDPQAFEITMTLVGRSYMDEVHFDDIPAALFELEEKATMLLQHTRNPNIPIRVYRHLPLVSSRPLHIAKTPKLIYALLNHGADINEPDNLGRTPLDHMLEFLFGMRPRELDFHLLHASLKALVENGGISRTTSKKTWKACIGILRKVDLDTTRIQECLNGIEFKEDGLAMYEVIEHAPRPSKGLKTMLTKRPLPFITTMDLWAGL
ncbi:hypothetical protein F4775DRAFT_607246 [Biscogniauxia sp. FL1348]|nr:hypothetical protein F4775DRAFT_607246 [Biscogniauxia sp. FL1348]